MAFADQPAPHGATKIDYRANENKPYVYQPYPGMRYHPELGSQIVRNEEQDKVLGPPWRDTPYPQKPVAPPPPEPTFDELKAEHLRLIDSIGVLRLELGTLQRENEDLRKAIQEHTQQAEAKAAAKKPVKPKTEAA